jgi:two-component system cell cycle sensor histidine kinase/response regulator CckA
MLGDTMNLVKRLRAGSLVFTLVAGGAFAVSLATAPGGTRDYLLASGAALAVIGLGVQGTYMLSSAMARRRLRTVSAFLEHDSAPGFCTDDAGTIIEQNQAATERFGSRIGETMNRALETLLANPEAVMHRLARALDGEGAAREDVVTRRGHVRLAVHPIPGGRLWRLEDLVDRSERASDGLGLPLLTYGPSGAILAVNDAFRDLVGPEPKRLRDVLEVVPPANGGLNRLRTLDGTRQVRLMLPESANGRHDVFILPAGERADGRVDLDALPVALLRLDAEGRVTFANRPAQDLLPQTTSTDETRLAAMVEGLGRSVREWVGEAAAGRGLNRPEIVRVTGAATETYLQVTLGRPIGDGGQGLVAVLNDATELKTMEAQFVQSQKMQAIGQLAGGVAHDFNNLLTAISGHCDLLLLRHGEGDEDHADLLQITQNANRAAALVGQLLAFSRKQTLQMQSIDLRDTLSDLTHLLNRLVGERVRVTTHHDPALLPIRGDRRQLEQVLMNLVVNARDAMPEGGDIRLETRCHYLEHPMTRDRVTVPPGQYVVVRVSDEGHGIPADKLARIFEPFYTTKRPGEGTGLGLSMAYGIVKQSGGYIFADSPDQKGAQFSLYFPAEPEGTPVADAPPAIGGPTEALAAIEALWKQGAEAACLSGPNGQAPEDASAGNSASDASEDIPAPEGAEEVRSLLRAGTGPTGVVGPDGPPGAAADLPGLSRRPRILLVEDEAPVRAFATRALRLRGYEVVEAACAEDALDALEDMALDIDLFVTDVMMPGLDGPSWVSRALKRRPDVRTVFMSGYTQDALSETSVPIPNAIFLAKPFSLADLTRTVERALTSSPA